MTPDFSRGYLRVPFSIWLAVFCKAPVTRRQLQLLAFVLRESWGWQTRERQVQIWTRPLTTSQFAQATGLAIDHLRRDLDQLLARGILREEAGRYQFVAEPELWKSPPPKPPKLRPVPLEWPVLDAEMAFPDLVLKKEYRKQRNVGTLSEGEFSTAGENPSSRSSLARSEPQSGAARISATAALRLVDVITAFVGSLSSQDTTALRLWISGAGVAGVWSALEPDFRQGAVAGRRRLTAILTARNRVARR